MRAMSLIGMTALALLGACASRDIAPLASPPQESAAASPQSESLFSVTSLQQDVQILSSDAFEGRKPSTPGEEKTVRYIAERMAKAGLQPGNNGSWYQDVPLVEITTDPSTTLSFTGKGAPLVLSHGKDVTIWTKRVEEQLSVADSDVVFVGYGINAPERGWNDYAGVDVRGKTVVILVNDPDWEMRDNSGPFDGRAMTYYGRWTYKYEEAARQGAAAAIIVHDSEPAAYGWTTVLSSWTGPQLDMDRANKGSDRVAAEAWITNDAARKLFALADQDFDRLTAAAKVKGFKAVPFAGVKAGTTLRSSIRRSKSKNVVGILPGAQRPDEVVIYTAHWDHLGRCKPDADGDDICNGAVDNATGIAGMLGIAEAFAKGPKPARSLVFLAVTAEEAGLLGSQYYGENPIYPHAKTVGGINLDALNVTGATNDVTVVGYGKSELEAMLQRAAATQGRALVPEATPEKGSFYRSDHFSLAKFGVPMLYAKGGNDIRGKGRDHGMALKEDYTAKRYHQPADEYDPNWDWTGMVEDLALYHDVGRELADGTAWPNWHPTAEFRTLRDRSRAGQ